MACARRQPAHCHTQHDGDQAEQWQEENERGHRPFRPCWYGGGKLRFHPSRLVRWSLSFGDFRSADNYLFHVSSARHITKINLGKDPDSVRYSCKLQGKTCPSPAHNQGTNGGV